MNEFKMRVIKHVIEHVKTNGKNTLTPRLFVKTKADNYKILELPGVFFEDMQNRDSATYAIKYINNNTNTQFCCFVAEARMGKIELSQDGKSVKKEDMFDGVTLVFQGIEDSKSEVMAFTIDDNDTIKPMITGNNEEQGEFESPFKHLF
tara:strand:+ start:3671 stop:4117 length:447 start_codon:yes stop_codon:yes gene_type:complete